MPGPQPPNLAFTRWSAAKPWLGALPAGLLLTLASPYSARAGNSTATLADDSATEGNSTKGPNTELVRHVLGLGFQQDLLILRSSRAACSGGSSYECYDGDGEFYANEPLAPDDSTIGFAGNEVSSGFKVATGRLLLSYDYLVSQQLALGVAGGFAFGYQSIHPNFLPAHFEGRLSYFFSEVNRGVLTPFLRLTAGLAQSAASQTLIVYDPDTLVYDPDTGGNTTGKAPETKLEAWTTPGRGFAGLGFGALLPLGASFNLVLEARAMMLWPELGLNTGLKAGLSYTF